jgi:Flp pilus assembly protein TadB
LQPLIPALGRQRQASL